MPSVAEEPPFHRASVHHGLAISSKKRRWEDDRSSSDTSSRGDGSVVSIVLPGDDAHLSHKRAAAAAAAAATTITTSIAGSALLLRGPPSPSQRKITPLGSKRLRLSSSSDSNSNSAEDGRPRPAKEPSSASAGTHAPSSMLPCHVCQRKPRRKSDLDSQADCEGCGQRACFVCLRECPGWTASAFRNDCEGQTPTDDTSEHGMCLFDMPPQQPHASHTAHSRKPSSPKPWSATSHGHRRIVCSRCCVERGQDGDVVCLGCMAS